MQFNEWLQSRLVVQGHPVTVDGAFGAATRKALTAFQKAKGLKESGIADKATVAALRLNPAKAVKAGEPEKVAPPPAETMPPWTAELMRRYGMQEGRDKAALTEFLKVGKFLGDPTKNPWCGDAMESAMLKAVPAEPVPANPFWAQAWKDFGIDAKGPVVGAIGVIKWSATAGHVGIVLAYDAVKKMVLLLGGNTGDAVKAAWYALGKFIAFRLPKTYPRKTWPALKIYAATGTVASTR